MRVRFRWKDKAPGILETRSFHRSNDWDTTEIRLVCSAIFGHVPPRPSFPYVLGTTLKAGNHWLTSLDDAYTDGRCPCIERHKNKKKSGPASQRDCVAAWKRPAGRAFSTHKNHSTKKKNIGAIIWVFSFRLLEMRKMVDSGYFIGVPRLYLSCSSFHYSFTLLIF